ncbi:MAG TPA: hypothetical protein PKY89_12115 [Deltaproteobacteria bacterium]|nr:hypothetical protein [Deltaproteobacteria bacterium]
MLKEATAIINSLNHKAVSAGGIILILAIGLVDLVTGYEISLSIFYMLPISIVTWNAGKLPGHALAIVSALIWLGADIGSGHPFSSPIIPFWNCMVRLFFFMIIVQLLLNLRINHDELEKTNQDLRESLENIKVLRGLIPICAWCKRVRNEKGFWQRVEAYVSDNSEAQFTHGICEDCKEKELRKARDNKWS